MCVDDSPCQVGTCPGLLLCNVPGVSGQSVCRVDTQATECAKLACPSPTQGSTAVYLDDVPCFTTQGSDCIQGRRVCNGQGWTCLPEAGKVDPFLCPFYDRCEAEAALPDSKYGSPASCLLDPKAFKLEPPITYNDSDYNYGELLATTGCPASCQLEVDIGGLLTTIQQGHGLNDPSTATCCFQTTNAVLGQNVARCRAGQAPDQLCSSQQQLLVTQDGRPWFLAIDLDDGGDLHRFVFAFDGGACQPGNTPVRCNAQAVATAAP